MNQKSSFFRSTWRILLALVFSLSLAGISTHPAQAGTYNVSILNDAGVGSLRAAITSANSNPGQDTISFSVSGTINLASNLPAIAEDLTINGSGEDVAISGQGSRPIFRNNYGVYLRMSNLTIQDGYLSDSNGAGIYNAGALTMWDMTFSGNTASHAGGAVFNDGGSVLVLTSTFVNNSVSAPSASGGAIYTNRGALTVVNCTFTGNSAVTGGGIFDFDGTTRIINNTFSGNTASVHGGALYSMGDTLELKNSILANSSAPEDCYTDTALDSDIHNLIEVNGGCGAPVSSADPKLGALADNGGDTQTLALLPGSPAFDAGDDATCSAMPVSNWDQRYEVRPHGAHCDIGSFEMDKGRLTFRSAAAADGWVLESTETSGTGDTTDSTGTTFRLGDDALNKQYRAILSFNTASLPDTALVTKVTLKIKKQGQVGTNPFTILGGLKADIRDPYFGTGGALAAGDFQAVADKPAVGTFPITPVSNWYSAVLSDTAFPYLNLTGTTQFRLRFVTDDNNDEGADYMKFYSGNYVGAASRPTLIIEYDIP